METVECEMQPHRVVGELLEAYSRKALSYGAFDRLRGLVFAAEAYEQRGMTDQVGEALKAVATGAEFPRSSWGLEP